MTGAYGVSNWCGPGLRCYQHVCKVCMDGTGIGFMAKYLTGVIGMVDSSDGKMCVGELWYVKFIEFNNVVDS